MTEMHIGKVYLAFRELVLFWNSYYMLYVAVAFWYSLAFAYYISYYMITQSISMQFDNGI